MIFVYMAVGLGIFCLLALRFVKITRKEGDQIFIDELKCRRDREDEWL